MSSALRRVWPGFGGRCVRPNPNLSYAAFRGIVGDALPPDLRLIVWPVWIRGEVYQAERIMKHWGMSSERSGEVIRRLSATLIPD